MDTMVGDKRSFSELEGNRVDPMGTPTNNGHTYESGSSSLAQPAKTPAKVETEIGQDGVEHAIIVPPRAPDLVYLKKTGICYDVRMRYHSHPNPDVESYLDRHPEDPRRTFRIYRSIAEAGLITDPTLTGGDKLGKLVEKLPTRAASDEELRLVHTPEHLAYINATERMTAQQLLDETKNSDSIYLNNDSSLAARLSCGSAIEACRAVVEGRVRNAMAVIRPPGHHAEPDKPSGFCLFSNVAVASRVMLRDYPDQVRKILIYDWDVHHGNGTMRAFEGDSSVLYISTHRHNGSSFYPGTPFAEANQVGVGDGKGYSVNIPWSEPGMGDGDYIAAFQRIIMPIALEYNPDLVIISAGFDAAKGDYIGQCNVTPACYAWMANQLKSLAYGKLVVCLEGGYNLDAISASGLAVAKVLLGDPPPRVDNPLPCPLAIETLETVITIQSRYWTCLQPRPQRVWDNHRNMQALNVITRGYEARRLAKTHSFAPLPVLGDSETETDDQVLATPGIFTAKQVLVVFHDPATVWSLRHPGSSLTGELRATDLVGGSLAGPYIEWAVANGFGVVDIEVPGPRKGLPVAGGVPPVPMEDAQSQAQEVVAAILKTVLPYLDAEKVVLMAAGTAYPAVVRITTKDNVPNCHTFLGFLPEDVPVRGQRDMSSNEWYEERTLVTTVEQHPWFSRGKGKSKKKPEERFGTVMRAEESSDLYSVMRESFENCITFITYE